MNTFLNIGYVSYLKEFDKCYMFSFSVLPKKKEANTFFIQTLVYKNEWTPKLQDGQRVFVKGNLAKEIYTDTMNNQKEVLKIYAEYIEIISGVDKGSATKKSNGKAREKEPKKSIDDKDYIPF